MARIGLLGRIMLILMGALSIVIVAVLVLAHWERRAQPVPHSNAPYPRIEQATGILDLLRRSDPALRPRILRALNGAQVRVSIGEQVPPETDTLRRAPGIEDLLRGYAQPGLDDGLRAYMDAAVPPRERGATEGLPARIVCPLQGGAVIVIDLLDAYASRRIALSLLGLPPGVWVGLLGIAVAALALYTTEREMRPLRQLTAIATDFDGHAPGRRLAVAEAGGAPDIRRLARAVHAMQERVAGLLQERSFLIGAISHDIKTYLTRLRLRAETLGETDQRGRMVDDLDAMTDLVETALAFARGTTVSQRRGRVDLADLAAVEVAERDALGQPLRFAGKDAADAVVAGDPVALRRVLANLVDNAVKFGRERVEIGVETEPTRCRVFVDDDGSGVGEAERAAIFSPFYRTEGSRGRRTGGSGLGLAIARQIVEAHGGEIAVAAGPLGGARFTVSLPRAAPG